MNVTTLDALRRLEHHLFDAHPLRVLDLLHGRHDFVEARECCPECQALIADIRQGAREPGQRAKAADTLTTWDYYPLDWPACACGEPVMDGHGTCGRLACTRGDLNHGR